MFQEPQPADSKAGERVAIIAQWHRQDYPAAYAVNELTPHGRHGSNGQKRARSGHFAQNTPTTFKNDWTRLTGFAGWTTGGERLVRANPGPHCCLPMMTF